MSDEDRGIQNQIESIEVIEGHPAEVILRRSKELGCDLIVLGAHDHGFTHTFLGTVAKRVLRRAVIPTLVVPYQLKFRSSNRLKKCHQVIDQTTKEAL